MFVIQASQLTKLAIILAFGFALTLLALNLTSDHMDGESGEKLQASEGGVAPEAQAPAERHSHVGGLGKAHDQPTREKDGVVFDLIEKIKPEFELRTKSKYDSIEVLNYKHQVVAGMNYFIKAKTITADGKDGIAHLRIYRDLKGDVELTSFQLDKTQEEELTFF